MQLIADFPALLQKEGNDYKKFYFVFSFPICSFVESKYSEKNSKWNFILRWCHSPTAAVVRR